MAKLLVIDDEEEICDFIREFFTEEKLEVDVAYSGREALEKIEKNIPDMCLLDISMPDMDGLEVLRSIRKRFPSVRVIMVTGMDTTKKIETAIDLGAVNYITKPLSLEYLRSEVLEKLKAA